MLEGKSSVRPLTFSLCLRWKADLVFPSSTQSESIRDGSSLRPQFLLFKLFSVGLYLVFHGVSVLRTPQSGPLGSLSRSVGAAGGDRLMLDENLSLSVKAN